MGAVMDGGDLVDQLMEIEEGEILPVVAVIADGTQFTVADVQVVGGRPDIIVLTLEKVVSPEFRSGS
jgi:alcohol dehydrogenase YqhD (iron-dependent ADH family)